MRKQVAQKKKETIGETTSLTISREDAELAKQAAEVKGMYQYKLIGRWIREAIAADNEVSHLLTEN